LTPVNCLPSSTSAVHTSDDSRRVNLASAVKAPIHVWHARLGHAAYPKIVQLARLDCVTGFVCSGQVRAPSTPCEPCALGKKTADSFSPTSTRVESPAQLVHFDIFTAGYASLRNSRYGLLIVDDHTSLLVVYFLRTRDDCLVKAHGHQPCRARSDNAKEFVGQEMKNVMLKHGVHHEFSTPHTPQQNGRAERQIRTVVEMARSLFASVGNCTQLWAEAVNTAVHVRNRLPLDRLFCRTPYEVWFGKKPDISHLRI
jgi:transposase InsO family protein